MSINRGVDKESVKNNNEKFRLLSGSWLRYVRLIRLISILWAVVLIQIMLCFDSHVRGINIMVGMIIFSIVVGLSFVHSLFHMYWRL